MIRLLSGIFALYCALVFATLDVAAQSPAFDNYQGQLNVKVAGIVVQRLKMQLLIADNNGQLSGQMVSVSQGGVGFECDSIERDGANISVSVKALGASFTGTQDSESKSISGNFVQNGLKIPISFEHKGTFEHVRSLTGKMNFSDKEFDFQFRIYRDAAGKQIGLMDSFTEKVGALICNVKSDASQLIVQVPNTRGKFEGRIENGKPEIEGHWIQSGAKIPLVLKEIPLAETRTRGKVVAEKPSRPQMPKGPFPYEIREVKVNPSKVQTGLGKASFADIELAGTLTIPKSAGPHPAVILISGSGPQDRDETIFDHKPFWVIADHLSRNGIAVLRFDERGVGESTGIFAEANSRDFASDVEALFEWLRTQDEIHPDRVGLIGHSEGGLIAPMIAGRNPDVAAIVMLAGPGVSGREILLNQTDKIARVGGADAKAINRNNEILRQVLGRMEDSQGFTKEFRSDLSKKIAALIPEAEKSAMPDPDAIVTMTIAKFDNPWMKFFVNHDPSSDLQKTVCPVLSLIGENDLQVDADLNEPAIRAALEAGKNPDFQLERLPKLNHLFQNSETGAVENYGKIEETIAPSVLNRMTEWLSKRLN